ncbi:hypothetical protein [Gemmatimonas phototrophica]|uniref:DUF4382 domain-containing protein n=1 Tax=Gemmatimonas phototrophica TaxID=1379270 RepID=A0A143BKI7_9BACT|nr:hypothetical protein [Gemmatimonas phototrophica]AMW05549.1 hypothetical protein GEMMAAP_13485 [Gemmatimonas phototrophica]
MVRLPNQALSFSLCAGAALLAACGEGTGPNKSAQVGVGFQLATTSASANVQSADGSANTTGSAQVATTPAGFSITSGADVILISKAQIVVKDVKLKSAAATCTDDDDDDDNSSSSIVVAASSSNGKSGSSKQSSSDDDDDDDDDCPTIRVGPYLVDVPVTGADGGRVAVMVPEGTYSSVRLSIHKVSSSDSADLAFRQANPDFRGISIRLQGTYNGQAFTFTHDVNAKLEVPLTAPITIGEGGDDVTVTIDMKDWFVRPNGGLYSPAEGNTPGFVRAKIQNNIRNAFRAFRDKDRDGEDDDR